MYPERVLKALQRAKANIVSDAPAAAISDLQKVIAKNPKIWDAWSLLGQAKGMLGDHAGAEVCIKQACLLNPRDATLWGNLGISFSIRGLFRDALNAYLRSASLSTSVHPDTLHNIGSCYIQLDQYEEAVRVFSELVQVKDNKDTWALLGMAYQGLDRYQEALIAYQKSSARGGGGYTLNLNLGTVYDTLNDYELAAQHAREALLAQPGDATALYNLGAALFGMGDVDEAVNAFSRSALPGAAQARLLAMSCCDTPDPEALRAEHEKVASKLEPIIAPRPSVVLVPGERMRIGFVSADFREHPVAFFLEGMLSKLDRSRFELHLFSDVRKEDAYTERFKALADQWIPVFGQDDASLVSTLRMSNLHILIDLAGHTNGSRLACFAQRPAPVQASYLGYSGTTGMKSMDYLLVDHILAPPELSEAAYSEKVVRLGNVFATYSPPSLPMESSPLPMAQHGYPTFGSFAQLRKITQRTVTMWIRVLQKIPNARLRVMTKGLENPAAQERFLKPFLSAGIDRHRFELCGAGSLQDFLFAHHDLDLILETLPWNGHTTTLHGLWMGVPTVTAEGTTHTGRFGKEIMSALALDRYLSSEENYPEDVANIISDLDSMVKSRANMRNLLLTSPLCDHEAMAQRFTQACCDMWAELTPLASNQ